MLIFITWTAIAILLWRVEALAYKIEKLKRQQLPAQPPIQTQPAPQNALKQPSIFEPLPEQKESAPATASPQPVAQTEPQKPLHTPITLDKVFSWVGGFVLLLGIIFCIKYSVEKNLISPAVRMALGVLTGAALWTAGACLKKENLKTTAHTLLACGLCVCYLTLFAGYHFYHIISAEDAFALLALIAATAFATAVWKKAFYIGILAQIIGFLTPFLLVSATPPVYCFLFGYGALITISAVIAAVKCNWNSQVYMAAGLSALYLLAFSLSAKLVLLLSFALLLAVVFAVAAFLRKQGAFLCAAFIAQVPLLLVLFMSAVGHTQSTFFAMALGWWGVYALLPLLARKTFLSDKAAWLTVAMVGVFIGVLLQSLGISEVPFLENGGIALFFALLYAGIFYAVYPWENLLTSLHRLRLSWLGSVVAFFIAVLICCALSCQWVPLALAAEGTLLVWLWHKIKLPVWQTLGTILLVLAGAHLPFVSTHQPITFLLNWYLYTYLLCAGLCFAGAYFWRKTTHGTAKTSLQILGGFMLFMLLNIEIASYFSQGETYLSFNICGQFTEAAAYTIAWALAGAGCLLLAVKPLKWLSKSGILLIGLALLKLFLSDIWQLPLAARIIVSIVVAFILLGISFFYQQMHKQI